MAVYYPPKKINTVCSKCNNKFVTTRPHNWLEPCDGRAIGFCPNCGYFTLKVISIFEEVLDSEEYKNALKELEKSARTKNETT